MTAGHPSPTFTNVGTGWIAATRGFQAEQTAIRRRNTDRTAAIGGMGDGQDAGRHRCRGAARGTTGGILQVPGVAASPQQGGFGGDV